MMRQLFRLGGGRPSAGYRTSRQPWLQGKAVAAKGDDLAVTVERVVDGDSVHLRKGGGRMDWLLGSRQARMEVRLYGIDAPELGQRTGAASTRELERLLRKGKGSLRARIHTRDRYGRYVAELYHAGTGIEDSVNCRMVRRGQAFWYRQYARSDGRLARAEEAARREGLGVWHGTYRNEPRPWDYRKGKRAPAVAFSWKTALVIGCLIGFLVAAMLLYQAVGG